MTRGERNNNPLNIRHGKSQWRGMRTEQTDPDFVQFESMEMGYRAAFILLHNYRRRYGIRTLRQIIFRWAPPRENNSYAYLWHVCRWSGIMNPDHVIEESELTRVMAAMHRQENGTMPDMEQIERGKRLTNY